MVFVGRRSVHWQKESQSERKQAIVGFTRTDLSRFDPSPLGTLDVQTDSSQGREENDSLQSNLFAFIMFWFGSPMKESNNILSHLGGGSRSAWRKKGILVRMIEISEIQRLPSSYSTSPSKRTRAMDIAPAGKNGL